MKNFLIMTLILFLIMIFFPFITLVDNDKKETYTTTEQQQTTGHTEESAKETVTLMVSATGKLTEMSAEEYVYGAVCAEMPASFHTEALKAQAVACYTYMKWLKENADNPSEINADITDSSAIHQAYLSQEELKEKWGNNYDIYSQKVKEAIESVLHEYLVYNGETAMTVFHALSPGTTKNASEIWKSDTPYLQSVTAPGDKLSSEFTSVVALTENEFLEPFSVAQPQDIDTILNNAEKDTEGFINELSYKNTVLAKTDLRSAYSLKSPYFQLEKKDNNIVITVYGKGHGIGMSQYSADYMARQGSSYKEILSHFYKGTDLVSKE